MTLHPSLLVRSSGNKDRFDMKKIGILGGMSAASTQIYYQKLCQLTSDQLGGLNSPDLLIRSLNFAYIEQLQAKGEWE